MTRPTAANMLRQQIAFCQERLSEHLAAENPSRKLTTLRNAPERPESHTENGEDAHWLSIGKPRERKSSKTATQKINPLISTEPDLTDPTE